MSDDDVTNDEDEEPVSSGNGAVDELDLDESEAEEDEIPGLFEEPETHETPEEAAAELEADEIQRIAAQAEVDEKGHHPGPFMRLYRGETSFDFVGKRRRWFLISSIIIVVGLLSLGVRGLNLGIEFKGGTAWTVKAHNLTQSEATKLAAGAGLSQPTVVTLGTGSAKTIEVKGNLNSLSASQRTKVSTDIKDALAKGAGVSTTTVSVTHVSGTWGSQVTTRALAALVVFFIVVSIYISFRFEAKMALAAFIAMFHDILVTIGVYSIFGFQVTPDTVIALLTILGYSLYDTVVVFDRIRDNSRGFGASGRMTYSEMVNLSMNQTLARSINTSLVAVIPVLSVLIVGAQLFGATTLQYYGLALTVGLISGAYSSIFIASPVLAMLKEREPRYVAIRQRLASRGDRLGLLTPAAAAALAAGSGSSSQGGKAKGSSAARPGTLRPGAGRAAKVATASAAAGAVAKSGRSQSAQGGSRPAATGVKRPPPRPRKGGGKGKKRR